MQLPVGLTATNPKGAVKQQQVAQPAPKQAPEQQPTAAMNKRTSSAPAPKQQSQQQPAQSKGPIMAAENPNAMYNGALAVFNAKSHSIKAIEEVLSPLTHFPATLHHSDLPPLPFREQTSVEDLLAALTERNRHLSPKRPATQQQKQAQKTNARAQSALAGPTPSKAVLPAYTSSYAAIAKHIPAAMRPSDHYDSGFEDSTMAGYLALKTQGMLDRRAAAEELHRQRYRNRIAPRWEMDLRGTKHLTDLFAAYRNSWNVDLRGTVFQRTVMKGTNPRAPLTPEQEELSITLCNTVLAEQGFQRRKTARNEQYLLNSFLLFI